MKVYRAKWDFQGQLRQPGSVGYTESGQAVIRFFLSPPPHLPKDQANAPGNALQGSGSGFGGHSR